ncbi:MAG: MFS transporter [Nocardioidaceae bacterium]
MATAPVVRSPADVPAAARAGVGFVTLYTLAFMSSCLMLIAPLLVTLALKVSDLAGADRAPSRLALVLAVGSFLSLFANPFFGKLSDRTTSRFGMRRPWMLLGLAGGSVGIVIVAIAPNIGVVLIGWCVAQVFFNALLAVQVAVLPDQVPEAQRGVVSGVLGICVPVASVSGTYLVNLFAGNQVAMFVVPCAAGAVFIVLFAAVLDDRRLDPGDRPPWSLREFAGTFYVSPRRNPDFAWVFLSRFLFVMAFAFLTGYQVYYLLAELGSSEGQVPHQVFVATLVSSAGVVAASLAGGRLSDWVGRRKVFVLAAALVYGLAMFAVALADDFSAFLVGVAVSGVGFGVYVAVDLALVTEVLPSAADTAKDLGVFNIANALPYTVAPALAPLILAISGGRYPALFAVAGLCAVASAVVICRVRTVR